MAKYLEKLVRDPKLYFKIRNNTQKALCEFTETRYLAKITKVIEDASVVNVVSKDYKNLLREIINGVKIK